MAYVSVHVYVYLYAYTPPHSGSRVTGDLEEMSAVVDRSPVLLPAALSAAYLYSRRIKRRTASSRERHNCVKNVLCWENTRGKKKIQMLCTFLEISRKSSKSYFRTLSTSYKSRKCDIRLPSPLHFSLSSVIIIFARSLWNGTFTRAKLPITLFSFRPLIDRFKDFLSHRTFFSGTADPRWSIGREDERICQNIADSSVHCRTIFRRLLHRRGGEEEGSRKKRVFSGPIFRSPRRFGMRDGPVAGR